MNNRIIRRAAAAAITLTATAAAHAQPLLRSHEYFFTDYDTGTTLESDASANPVSGRTLFGNLEVAANSDERDVSIASVFYPAPNAQPDLIEISTRRRCDDFIITPTTGPAVDFIDIALRIQLAGAATASAEPQDIRYELSIESDDLFINYPVGGVATTYDDLILFEATVPVNTPFNTGIRIEYIAGVTAPPGAQVRAQADAHYDGIRVMDLPEGYTLDSDCASIEDNRVASPCLPDLNADGFLDNGDIGTFVALFLAGDPAADFNGDTFLDNGDIGAFVNAFIAGC